MSYLTNRSLGYFGFTLPPCLGGPISEVEKPDKASPFLATFGKRAARLSCSAFFLAFDRFLPIQMTSDQKVAEDD